jgi:hypothetical protein
MAVAAHDEVVEQADIDQSQRPGESQRDVSDVSAYGTDIVLV